MIRSVLKLMCPISIVDNNVMVNLLCNNKLD